MAKLKGKRITGEPGTIEYGGYKIYNNKGEGGANYLITAPGAHGADDGANTLGEAKAIVRQYLGKRRFDGGAVMKSRGGTFKGVF
tara:strand:- start:305 stop:559 length:255 start_codon:yes stop_codon:yes gene_type:complete